MTIVDMVWDTLSISLFVLTAGSLVGLLAWSTWHTCRKGVEHLQQLHRVPCHRCQYFTGDYRLKCTVQPLHACTTEAIDCRDYAPRALPPQQPCYQPWWLKSPAKTLTQELAKDLTKDLTKDLAKDF